MRSFFFFGMEAMRLLLLDQTKHDDDDDDEGPRPQFSSKNITNGMFKNIGSQDVNKNNNMQPFSPGPSSLRVLPTTAAQKSTEFKCLSCFTKKSEFQISP